MAKLYREDLVAMSGSKHCYFRCDFGIGEAAVEWIDPDEMKVGIFKEDDGGNKYLTADKEIARDTLDVPYITVRPRNSDEIILHKVA